MHGHWLRNSSLYGHYVNILGKRFAIYSHWLKKDLPCKVIDRKNGLPYMVIDWERSSLYGHYLKNGLPYIVIAWERSSIYGHYLENSLPYIVIVWLRKVCLRKVFFIWSLLEKWFAIHSHRLIKVFHIWSLLGKLFNIIAHCLKIQNKREKQFTIYGHKLLLTIQGNCLKNVFYT
jgi:branched-subunit amino acid transport protein AzlD